jgi:protein-glucosylgalactosylhydroxylysine glucosidase
MLSAFLPYYAAKVGLQGQSEELLETGYGNFVNDPWLEADEFTKAVPGKPRVGPMFANIGGFLTTLYYGYPGLRLTSGDPGSWCQRPVVMPAGWRGLHVERIYGHGDEYSLIAEAGSPAAVLDGKRLRRVS